MRPARVADRGRRVPPASEPQRIQQLARLAPDRAAQLPADDTARLEQQDGVPLPSGGFLEPCGSRKSVGLIAQRPRPQAQHSGLGARLGLRALRVPPLSRPWRQRHQEGREGGARALGLAQRFGLHRLVQLPAGGLGEPAGRGGPEPETPALARPIQQRPSADPTRAWAGGDSERPSAQRQPPEDRSNGHSEPGYARYPELPQK
mmetsp:Transcript_4561/g.9859  ORF Transcript_4561/g.9859 Transcript_4561/m.9859 type:complete len:204 (+) Transcript_4561:60-671(+)